MNKLKYSLGLLIMAFTAFALSFAMSQNAFADPEPVVQDDRSSSTTGIPFVHTMNAGATADLSDITYTISITGTAKEVGTLGSYASTGIAPLTLPFANGVITPATPDPAMDADRSSDAIKVWVDSKTLAQLFGSDDKSNTDAASGYPKFAANFPQAGIYKFAIAEARAGDEPSKWEYEPWKTDDAAEPPVDEAGTYTLVVFIANDTGADVTKRHYDGWYLIDNATGNKVTINTTDNSESGADFTSTYKATSTLNVTKQVSGDYASTTHPFEQTITLYLPDWAAKQTIDVAGKNDGTWTPTEIPADGATERVYTVSLAHGQTASFANVPVGTRYKIQESTGDDGKAVDAANLKYAPKITWGDNQGDEQGDNTISVTKTWNNLQIPDLSYEETLDMLKNTLVSYHGETQPFLGADSEYPNGHASVRSFYNIYNNETNFNFICYTNSNIQEGDNSSFGTINMGADTSTTGFISGWMDIMARTTNTTTRVKVDASEGGWDVKDLVLIYNGKNYSFNTTDDSIQDEYVTTVRPIVSNNAITQQEDLLTYFAIVANGLLKNPDIEEVEKQYVTGVMDKTWGSMSLASWQPESIYVEMSLKSESKQELDKVSSDLLDAVKAYWNNPNIAQLPQYGSNKYLSLNITCSNSAVTALNNNNISSSAQLTQYIFGTTDWQTWGTEHGFNFQDTRDEEISQHVYLSF